MNIEDQLRIAMRRQDPSPGFANRVIAKAKPAPPARRPVRIWGPAMAAVAAMLVAGIGIQEYREQRQAERAREQAELALQIAAEKFMSVQSKAFSALARDRREQ